MNNLPLVGNKYELGNKIGEGAYAEIFEAMDTEAQEKVAVKLEKMNCKYTQVIREARLIKFLECKESIGIPRIKWCGLYRDFRSLVMELLGRSLEDLFNQCGRQFTLKTILMIADQALERLQFVHGKKFVHRDIKPDNFLLGTGKLSHVIYIIDFGLSKKYQDRSGRFLRTRHISSHGVLRVPARYASISHHMGLDISPRDDLESLGYVLLYFLRGGKLPWQGIQGSRSKLEKYYKVFEMKHATNVESLCEGLRSEFCSYLKYVRSLGIEENPNYDFQRRLFREKLTKLGYKVDYRFDWVLLDVQLLRSTCSQEDHIEEMERLKFTLGEICTSFEIRMRFVNYTDTKKIPKLFIMMN